MGMAGLASTTYRKAKRLVVLVIGLSVLFVGVLMIVLPGPALVLIPAGLAILASEFLWARRLLRRVKRTVVSATKPNKPSNPTQRDP